jgi:hypothetical protein
MCGRRLTKESAESNGGVALGCWFGFTSTGHAEVMVFVIVFLFFLLIFFGLVPD